jgi:hypothetical protein
MTIEITRGSRGKLNSFLHIGHRVKSSNDIAHYHHHYLSAYLRPLASPSWSSFNHSLSSALCCFRHAGGGHEGSKGTKYHEKRHWNRGIGTILLPCVEVTMYSLSFCLGSGVDLGWSLFVSLAGGVTVFEMRGWVVTDEMASGDEFISER